MPKTVTTWPLSDWKEPDLDRGYIPHKSLSSAEVAELPSREIKRVVRAAEEFATNCEKDGIPILAEEWIFTGRDADDNSEYFDPSKVFVHRIWYR